MGVHVHETWEEVQSISVQLADASQVVSYIAYATIGDPHVCSFVEAGGRVEEVGVADDELAGAPFAAAQAATSWVTPVASARTAERTEVPAAT